MPKRPKNHVESITSVLQEERQYAPSEAFRARAGLGNAEEAQALRQQAETDPEAYWCQAAREELRWQKPFTQGLDWSNPPHARWFADGEINLSDNCLDRHCDAGRGHKAALIWEGEPVGDAGPEVRTLTYSQLRAEVQKAVQVLHRLGLRQGDRVAIYMPLIPEAAIAMLACARMGAVHSVIFGGFSAESLRDRVNDAGAKVIITADGGWRRGQSLRLKDVVDLAIAHGTPGVESVLVVRRTGDATPMHPGRDHWWHEHMLAAKAKGAPARLSAEHPLFILYTSGTTGKPKGILHTTGGYLTHVTRTFKQVFDVREDDLYWCTADVGWITGHSYVVYGPLSAGATVFLYEGAPAFPEKDRFWDIIERHRVTIFYTAPTALRTFMAWGETPILQHDLSSLRLLGTVGEPINPAAWVWYHEVIGGGRCPIVDTWWQTETGGILIAPLPGVQVCIPGTATRPLPGFAPEVVNPDGVTQPDNVGGLLVLKHPWPGMARTIWGDDKRFADTYFSRIPGIYFTGDGARRDASGNFWIMGRVDDVLNVSGHRIGTMEVESALVSHPLVAEAAVVGRPDPLTGQALVAFVTMNLGTPQSPELAEALRQHVAKEIGALARPAEVRFAAALPKTRSGKIMRRLLRELASQGTVSGDTTTLEDFSVLETLRAAAED